MLHNTDTRVESARKPRDWSDNTMRFGLFWPGTRTKLPSAEIAALNPDNLDLGNHIQLARACEDIGLDFVLLGDGYAPSSEEGTRIGFQDPGIHALMLSSPIIMATRYLGVITTLHSTYFHPAHIARFAANMDWLSGGRWGWNIVNGYRDYEASLFGFETLPDRSSLYEAADEAIEIIDALWDPSARTAFSGKHYRSHGKMKGPYPSERPVYVCAAASESGRRFTAKNCQYLFASPTELSDVVAIKNDLANHAKALGKSRPPEALVVADLLIRDEPGVARTMFDELMGTMQANEAGKKWTSQIGKLRSEDKEPLKFPSFVGTPTGVAEQLVAAHRDYGLNGVMFRPLICSPEEMRRLGEVFGILERAGARIAPASRNYSW